MAFHKVILVIGRRQTGKTTFVTNDLLQNKKKVLVVDTYDHPSYRDAYKVLPGAEVGKWKNQLYRTFDLSPVLALQNIFTQCYDGIIVLEDAAKYLDANVPRSIKQGFIDHRNRGLDIIVMFHSLSDVPPYLCKMFNDLILFKTNDDPSVKLTKFGHLWHEIVAKHQQLMNDANPYAKARINLQ